MNHHNIPLEHFTIPTRNVMPIFNDQSFTNQATKSTTSIAVLQIHAHDQLDDEKPDYINR